MANFIIKSAAGTGNKTLIQGQDQSGSAYAVQVNDAGATTLTNATITAGSIASAVDVGKITNIDVWRLTTSFSGGGFITANLERQDTGNPSALGTGMTESSGVFTFPATGHWLVMATGSTSYSGAIQFFELEIHLSDGSGGYNSIAEGTWNSANANARLGSTVTSIIDITNVVNKVKFKVQSAETDAKFVSTDNNRFYFQFIRLSNT